jgi:AraC-like DNA-binding protein
MQRKNGELAARLAASHLITVQRMVDLIEKAYADRITLQTVSAALRGRPVDMGRLFHAHVGVSVHEYLTQVRLEHAAHLILSSVKIEAVSLSVGYRSTKNFYRQFIRHFGVTPETYRRRGGPVGGRRRPSGKGAHGNLASKNVTTYGATFDHTACRIDVEPRLNVKGSLSYVATPYVVGDHGLQPFAPISDRVEILAETEADAIERAALFLEHRFGVRSAAPKRHDDKRVMPIRSPRR